MCGWRRARSNLWSKVKCIVPNSVAVLHTYGDGWTYLVQCCDSGSCCTTIVARTPNYTQIKYIAVGDAKRKTPLPRERTLFWASSIGPEHITLSSPLTCIYLQERRSKCACMCAYAIPHIIFASFHFHGDGETQTKTLQHKYYLNMSCDRVEESDTPFRLAACARKCARMCACVWTPARFR